MNHTPDRGPRHEDDDHSQSSNERDEPTYEEREEAIRERDADELNDVLLDIGTRPGALFRHQAE